MFSKIWTTKSTKSCSGQIERLQEAIRSADAVLIGAGAGLSTSAGFTYKGERFKLYFSDFEEKYGFHDMYTGGFYPYETLEEHWAYWSRYIYINRYMDAPKPVYHKLLELVQDKDYFVLTTNVDHQFQKAGFDRQRLYYTQGDYGLLQCSEPCHQETYENAECVREMVEAQGYVIDEKGTLVLSEETIPQRKIPSKQIPVCPRCGRPMSMNLRADATFVEDAGWHRAAERYAAFLGRHQKSKIVFLELGVGYNTPGIIKYPFWQMTAKNRNAVYVCINYSEAVCPKEIAGQAVCIDGDIEEVLSQLI